jgi:hypothetical protein
MVGKIFQNDHVKTIQMKKGVPFLWYGLGYKRWKKGIGKSKTLECISMMIKK